jgi:hypothetical protein
VSKLTVPPVGVLGVPESVSVTMAVQVVALPTDTEDGEHATDVDVERAVTITLLSLPKLVAWVESPP